MNAGELILIALALAVDAATYAFSYGLSIRQGRWRAALVLAAVVGVFQAAMPLMGYIGGVGLREVVESWGSVLVFIIFAALGASVIYKAWAPGGKEGAAGGGSGKALGALGLLVVGFATSMDAFATGICLAMGRVLGGNLSALQVALAAGVIGAVTFAAALVCFQLSRLLHHLPERWLESLAGVILIALGLHQLN